ncbi:heavy metal-binding domain-containing protein [Paracoccus sp. SSK6]|uniref:heavy metal-binding domain-containing protein n=1 Tax=Paracoccus sp. SSK6 TaxID=3143131 RepID=UPI00321C3994
MRRGSPICEECGKLLWRVNSTGLCEACASAKREAVASARAEKDAADQAKILEHRPSIFLTTEDVTGLPLERRLGVIAADCAFGLHAFKNLFVEVGGRSKTIENALADARAAALDSLLDRQLWSVRML